MRRSARVSGQRWRIHRTETGIYRLTTEFLGDARSLEPRPGGLGFGVTADTPSQEWSIERIR